MGRVGGHGGVKIETTVLEQQIKKFHAKKKRKCLTTFLYAYIMLRLNSYNVK